MDLQFALVAAVAALLVGLSKGGLNMLGGIAVPLMALVMSPVQAAALLLPIYIVSDMVGLWSYRREFDRRNLLILGSAGMVGIAIGWATASCISDHVVGLMIGLVGVGFCFQAWRQRNLIVQPRPADVPRGVFWGTLMGFSSFVSHSGGPPYQVYVLPQQLPKAVYAGTTTILFAIINAVKLVPYWALGQLQASNLRTTVWLMPVAIAGTLAGVRLVRVIPQRPYYIAVQVMLFAVSVKLIIDAFVA